MRHPISTKTEENTKRERVHHCRRTNLRSEIAIAGRDAAMIGVVAILASFILVATPGFFSHDELQIMDQVRQSGGGGVWSVEALRTSNFFRPMGYRLLQAALTFGEYPLVAHGLMVLLHAVVCVCVFFLIRAIDCRRAPLTGVLFAVSPLTAFAVGWVPGIYDVLVTGFMVIALLAGMQWARGASRSWLIVLGAATVGALLSKETWVVLPAFVFALRSVVDDRTVARALARIALIMAGLVLVYLAARYPGLSRLAASGVGGYSVTIGPNVVRNLIVYLAFPFHVTGAELSATVDAGISGTPGYSLLVLLILVTGAFVAGLSRTVAACCAFYVGYLLPVLVTARCEAQYLYGSGVPFAYLLSAVLTAERAAFVSRAIGGFAVLLLVVHTVTIDTNMYSTGRCQTRLLDSIDAFATSKPGGTAGSNELVGIFPATGSKWWILARTLNATNDTGGARERFKFERDPAKAQLVFSVDCAVTRRFAAE